MGQMPEAVVVLSKNYTTTRNVQYSDGSYRLDVEQISNFTSVNSLNNAPIDYSFAVTGFKTPIKTYYTTATGISSYSYPDTGYLYWTLRLAGNLADYSGVYLSRYAGFYGYNMPPLMNEYSWKLYAGEGSTWEQKNYSGFATTFKMKNMCIVPMLTSINPSKIDINGNYKNSDTERHTLAQTPMGNEVLEITFQVVFLYGYNLVNHQDLNLCLKPFLVNVALFDSYWHKNILGKISYSLKGPFPGIMYTATPWMDSIGNPNPVPLSEAAGEHSFRGEYSSRLAFKSPYILDDHKPNFPREENIYKGYYITSFLPDKFLKAPNGKVGWVYNDDFKASIIKLLESTTLRYSLDYYNTKDDWEKNSYIPKADENGKPTYQSDEYLKSPRQDMDGFNNNWIGIHPGNETPESDPTKTINGVAIPDDTNKIPTINLFNRTFALTSDEVRKLADELWNADDTKFQEIVKGLALMGGNPIQALIDLRAYPIDFTTWTGEPQVIVCGRTKLDVTAHKIETGTIPQIAVDLGIISGQFKNFMDFEPFSTYQIYMPFVGTRDIPANLVVGHYIKLKASIDIITGAISYIVYADSYPILYTNGVIGTSVPMTADNAAEYAGNIIHATNNIVQQAATATKNVANDTTEMAHPKTAIAGAVSVGADIAAGASAIATAGYDLSTTLNQTTIQQSGCASPSNSLYTSMNVYILQEYHNPVIPLNYAHDIGRACRISGQISSFSGYTIFSNVDLSGIQATESEKEIILETLQHGVYL